MTLFPVSFLFRLLSFWCRGAHDRPFEMCQAGDGCSQHALPGTHMKGLCYDGFVLHVLSCSLVVAFSWFCKWDLLTSSIALHVKYYKLLRTISPCVVYSSSSCNLTNSSIKPRKGKKKQKPELYLPWCPGRAQPLTAKHQRPMGRINSTMTRWKETCPSSS